MFDKTLDNYGKAVESTLSLQQEILRNWTVHWSPHETQVFDLLLTEASTSASATQAAALPEPLSTAKAKWAEAIIDMLKRHQETLDEQYRASIRAIDDAFRVGEARDPEQFRRLSEELWRRNCQLLETAVASQMHDFQSVMQRLYEAATGRGGNESLIHRN
jgi:predicted protein tyrosine phosphatase